MLKGDLHDLLGHVILHRTAISQPAAEGEERDSETAAAKAAESHILGLRQRTGCISPLARLCAPRSHQRTSYTGVCAMVKNAFGGRGKRRPGNAPID